MDNKNKEPLVPTQDSVKQMELFEPTIATDQAMSGKGESEAMSINLQMPDITELKPKITVLGVGGAGGNAVNNMITSGLEGVEFVVANTDAQALASSRSERRIQMGLAVTEGLGAGSQPEVGRAAAEEVIHEISDHLAGSHMAFITAGMGGGTGTGAAPVVARAAREMGILTVGVVTKPFDFEGARRMRLAESGIEDLQANVDTLIVIPNQNLFRIANEKTTFADAFSMADQVLYSGVACITDLMVKEGLINLDFADVRSVMREMGKAMMGTGEASGENRAQQAAEAAIANPLLDETTMQGARGLLISITGGNDLTLFEVDEAATRIRKEVDTDANIILGATFDENLEGVIRVSVVATGIEKAHQLAAAPVAQPTAAPAISEQQAALEAELDVETTAAPAPIPTAATAQFSRPAPATNPLPRATPQPAAIKAPAAPAPAAAKTDPAVTISPFTPSAEAYQLARGVADVPAVEELADETPAQAPVEAAAPAAPYIPPAPERPVRAVKMPTVEDFPVVVQNELRAQTAEAAPTGEDERGAMGLLKKITGVALGGAPREGEAEQAPTQAPVAATPAQAAMQPAAPAAAPQSAFAKQPVRRRPIAQAPAQVAPAGNLDAHGRGAAPAKTEDDQLEIPAFLRRQS